MDIWYSVIIERVGYERTDNKGTREKGIGHRR